ncbi:189_t:CDS:2 [Ambispora gerdemannii]|uniref:189_t:CDS:1 n=1 Tax=Ambispora gerdemannii TaxID=144530 RepID=A0A9N9B8N2_9GLOM|nr:189_t:CDS:2 [Ambispora gerdemannii]
MVSSMLPQPALRIPDAVHPPVPGESHRYYGNIHVKQVKLPSTSSTPNYHSQQRQSKEDLSNGADRTIYDATSTGNLARVQELLDPQGVAETSHSFLIANEANQSSGLTPLHYAASRGHLEIVRYLIDTAGAIIDMEDPTGETALLKASYIGHTHVVAFLLQRKAKVDQVDNDGWTALHNASSQGHIKIVKYLYEHGGADLDAKSSKGHTPLMNAASKGHLDIVEYLLACKANPLIKNNFGEAAYDVAAISHEVYVCEILERAERDWWRKKRHIPGPTSFGELMSTPAMNQPYDVLAFHISIPVVLHENQRASNAFPILRGPAKYSPLVKGDSRGPWSEPSGIPTTKEEIQLPMSYISSAASVISNSTSSKHQRLWFWYSDWQIDFSHPRVDSQGWQYARSFDDLEQMWVAAPPTSGSGWVRRRRWVRVMKRRLDSMEPSFHPSLLQPIKDYESPKDSIDYIKIAEDALNKGNGKGKAVSGLSVQDELARHQEAIGILLKGIKSDPNQQRRQEASSLATTILTHAEYLENLITDNRDASPTSKDLSTNSHTFNSFPSLSKSTSGIANRLNRVDSTTSLSSFQTVDDPSWNTSSPNVDAHNPSSFSGSTLLQPTGIVAGISSKLNASATSTSTWEHDGDVHDCRRCNRKFGLWIRRHHCRKCGQVVCDRCSTARVELPPTQLSYDPSGSASDSNPSQASQLHRVCDSCYKSMGFPGRQRSNSLTTASIISGASLTHNHNHQRRSSNSSTMSQCPVCSVQLINVPEGPDEHLRTCLENGNGINTSGLKYVGEQAAFCA